MDIGLYWNDTESRADFSVLADDLALDEGLETAVIISLFVDERVDPSEIPEGEDPRGYWGDLFPEEQNDITGSKLWLLDRSKATQDKRLAAKGWAERALKWMVDDGVASSVEVEVEFSEYGSDVMTALSVVITKPDGQEVPLRYQTYWTGQENKR